MKMICSQKRYGSMLPLVLLFPLLASGCGQGKGTVSGKVTYQGKAVPSGFVTFIPEQGGALHSDIQSDGSYRLNNVPVGQVKISVEPKKSAQDTLQSSAMPRNPKDFGKAKAAMTENSTQIPSRYTDPEKSQLTYTVTKGSQQHDIDLK
jgi:hypothetical protein